MNFDELGNGDKMAGMRTALAFQRNRIAADRTLMAVIRTSLSMIGFGFTIYTFTTNIIQRSGALGLLRPEAPTRFGLTLIFLGVLILSLGIVNHYQYMQSLRHQRQDFIDQGLMPQKEMFPVSLALITAFLLALLGLYTAVSIILRAGLFF
jgi:putative membrane protein